MNRRRKWTIGSNREGWWQEARQREGARRAEQGAGGAERQENLPVEDHGRRQVRPSSAAVNIIDAHHSTHVDCVQTLQYTEHLNVLDEGWRSTEAGRFRAKREQLKRF